MWLEMRAATFVACLTLACVAIGDAQAASPTARYDDHGTAGLIKVTTTEYTNNNYGYSVAIPAGAVAWMNAAPAPNHGIRIFLGSKRSIEVDASFDAALLGSTSAVAEDAAQENGGTHISEARMTLAGMPAERVCTNGPGERRRIVVAQWFDQGGNNAINYVMTLQTTSAAFEHDRRTFDDVVRSFKTVPRAP